MRPSATGWRFFSAGIAPSSELSAAKTKEFWSLPTGLSAASEQLELKAYAPPKESATSVSTPTAIPRPSRPFRRRRFFAFARDRFARRRSSASKSGSLGRLGALLISRSPRRRAAPRPPAAAARAGAAPPPARRPRAHAR